VPAVSFVLLSNVLTCVYVCLLARSQKLLVAAALARAGRRVTVRDRADVLDAVRREYGGLFEYEHTQ
jgi:hypothetical protein